MSKLGVAFSSGAEPADLQKTPPGQAGMSKRKVCGHQWSLRNERRWEAEGGTRESPRDWLDFTAADELHKDKIETLTLR